METFGIKGEPKKGIVSRNREEGTSVRYDPNTQTLTWYDENGLQYDHFDCSPYETWEEVREEVLSETGWNV
jgi:hypothetical protein